MTRNQYEIDNGNYELNGHYKAFITTLSIINDIVNKSPHKVWINKMKGYSRN